MCQQQRSWKPKLSNREGVPRSAVKASLSRKGLRNIRRFLVALEEAICGLAWETDCREDRST